MVARQVSLVTGKGRPQGKGSGRGKSHAVSMNKIINKNAAASSAKKKLIAGSPSTTRRRVTIAPSKQIPKLNVDATYSGNERKVVMTVVHPGSSGSINSNSAVQLYVKPVEVANTTKNRGGGLAAYNDDEKLLEKTVRNYKVNGLAAVQIRGGVAAVRGGGKAPSNMTSRGKNTAMGTSSINNRSSSNDSSSQKITALTTAKLVVSAGSHPKNSDIKQRGNSAKEPTVQASQALSQTPVFNLSVNIEKAASIMLGVKREEDSPLPEDSNWSGGGSGGGRNGRKSIVDANGRVGKKMKVKHQGADEDGASSSSSTSSSSSSSAATAGVATIANSSSATAAASSSGSSAGGLGEKKEGKRNAIHTLPYWVGNSFNECGKRARRPPPRFSESGLDSKEESILRQAIENSKIETHLCDTVEIAEVPTFCPNATEFADPIQFIESVRGAGEHFGIIKIIPPEGWSPPPEALVLSSTVPFKTRLQSLQFFKQGTGFADGKNYTFAEYEAMAHTFAERWKEERYVKQGMEGPSLQDLERDYWRIIETSEEVVDVEYGNDLDTLTYGSGFPRAKDLMVPSGGEGSEERFATETIGKDKKGRGRVFGTPEYYERCGWNMNNLPLWPGSVLRYIRAPLKGVNVPWLYMGMQFATFCWHNEDNFMYSINYLHKGAPKQWYSIPGSKADLMEKVMKGFLREVFDNNPDLLHHMTNQFHPVLFHRAGVPVFKAHQQPGEFIVTFPKSFHAGFNYGFNVAEAVNFSPPHWLPVGREAVERYRKFARESVVSHDRLVLTLAHNLCPEWSIPSLRALLRDLTLIVKEEEYVRNELSRQGLRVDVVPTGNLLPNNLKEMDDASLDYDEKRACLSCKHVCFLSAVACECSEFKVACLREVALLCDCKMEERYLMAWHSISALWGMVRRVDDYLKARQEEVMKKEKEAEDETGGTTTSDGDSSSGAP